MMHPSILSVLGRARALIACAALGLAAPALVAAVLVPSSAEAKKKKKKKEKDKPSGDRKAPGKDESDLGEKGSYGTPEVVKEKERTKVQLEARPTLTLDDFRSRKEAEKKEKIDEQLKYIEKIISMEPAKTEMPGLLFQKAELYLEQSEFFFFAGMGLDDKILEARDKKNKKDQKKLEAEKKKWLEESKRWKKDGVEIFAEIVDKYPTFDRLADVVYSLAQAYWDGGDKDKAIPYYRQLITKYPQSQFVPDAWLAFGEYYFGKADIQRALEAYQRTASYEDSKVFAYAVYKQGWCYYNKGQFEEAGDKFKEVILYSELNPKLLGDKKITLGREARKDFVVTFSHYGDPRRAVAEFKELTQDDAEQRKMLERLSDIYFGEGKDREAIVMYRTLMAMTPDDTRNPFFQARIVTCAKRLNDKRFVVKMARELVDHFQRVRTFAAAHKDDPKLNQEKVATDLADAEDLSDNTLRVLATTWHNEARKTKDDETFELAYELYGDYLDLFPDKKPAYEIRFFYAELLYHLERFEKAGDEYTKVLLIDPAKGKWSPASAEEAVRAYDEAVSDFDRKNKRPPLKGEAALKPLPVPNIKKKLLMASDNYIKHFPKGSIVVECKYKIAKTLYDYNNFDQAAERFLEITTDYPDNSRAEQAANLTLDIYNLRQEWKKLNGAARSFSQSRPLMKNEAFAKTLSEILENSSFKLIADEYEVPGDNLGAAKQYLKFVDEFPKSELADKAMINAASNFLKAGKDKESIQVRLRLVKAYPKSPLVPDAMYAIAESYEQVVDYKDAAEWLEKFVKLYPKDPRSKDALFNASIYREGLGQFKQALSTREEYLKTYPKADDVATIYLSLAGLHKQMSDEKKASEVYQAWGKKYGKGKDEEWDAKFKAVDVMARDKKSKKQAEQLEQGLVREYVRLGKKGWSQFKNETDAQARIRFTLADEEYEKYKKVKIEYPRDLNKKTIKKFQDTLKAKVAGKDKIKGVYTEVVKLGRPEWAIASLYRIGDVHLHLVDAIVKTPAPKGLNEEQADLFKEKLREQTFPIEEQGAEAFKLCVDKSKELNLFNQWTQKCINFLEENRPDQHPQIIEELAEVKAEVPLPPPHGLVTTLKAVAPAKSGTAESASPDDKKDTEGAKTDAPAAEAADEPEEDAS
ncbi:MAG: tetratricopeptide repeat protein [Pseudomonadota bacterium]